MNKEMIAQLLEVGVADKEKNVEVLKQALIDNDYKVSVRGALLFLDNCSEALPEDCVFYWRAVALNLPVEV